MNFERASLLYHQKINQLIPVRWGSLFDSEVGGSAAEHKIILTTTAEWETPWIRAPFFYLIPSETQYLLKGTQWEVRKPKCRVDAGGDSCAHTNSTATTFAPLVSLTGHAGINHPKLGVLKKNNSITEVQFIYHKIVSFAIVQIRSP